MSTPTITSDTDILIQEIYDYIESKLIKPTIIEPALYLNPGVYPISDIPHKIKDTKKLNVTDESFTIDNDTSYIEISVEDDKPFYVINNQYVDPRSQSKNTPIKFGYGRNPIYSDKLHQLPWLEQNGKADSNRLSWWEECKNSARILTEKHQDVAIMLSGGLDSQLIAAAFLDAGLKFRPYFMKYLSTDGQVINNYDYQNVLKFCNKNDLELDIEDINIISDISLHKHLDYQIEGIWETYSVIPALYTHSYAIEKFNNLGFMPVFGTDIVEIKMDAEGKPSLGDSSYCSGHGPVYWAHEKNYDFVYNFMSYTPNQVLSYLDLPEIKNMTTLGYDMKSSITRKYGSDRVVDEIMEKSTGYEYIKNHMRKIGKRYHDFTREMVDSIDWSQKPTTQYIHNIDHILEHNEMKQFKIIRITSKDWTVNGFKQNVPEYYNL
jgi:hypothetical protein